MHQHSPSEYVPRGLSNAGFVWATEEPSPSLAPHTHLQLEIPTVNHPWQAPLQILTPPTKHLHRLQDAKNSVLFCFHLTVLCLSPCNRHTVSLYHRSIDLLLLVPLILPPPPKKTKQNKSGMKFSFM